jgi:KipI family sensor histidine kinase inhibitor
VLADYKIAGDCGIVVEFENEISERVNAKVTSMSLALEKSEIKGIEEVIPTYRSLLVLYDPLVIVGAELIAALKSLEKNIKKPTETEKPRTVEIPVVYGGEFGPDLDFVAQHNGLPVEAVIKIHAEGKYRVYMLGFTPGFPYLGGMSPKIAAPRLENPRTRMPAGSIGIAGNQTGIYPVESPGGWRLIGRTPLKLFDSHGKQPFLLQAGDYLKFIRINEQRYHLLKEQVEKDRYFVSISRPVGSR